MTFQETVIPALGPEERANELARQYRDALLAASDWTQLPDVSIDQTAWATYRQQLRDAPNHPAWPNVEVPEVPTT